MGRLRMSIISSSNNIIFSYMKQPLNKYTFKAPQVKKWIEEHCKDKLVLNLFAGPTRLLGCTEITNDLDESFGTMHNSDALDLVIRWIRTNPKYEVDVIILDPPYSYRKSMELYNGHRNSRFKRLLDIIPIILKPYGKVITFGYHASVMGKNRGFRVKEILIVYHSGAQHSTLATVEERI